MIRFLGFILLATLSTAQAVVIRHDVPDIHYRAAMTEFPALADLPVEGHGVLIDPQWVLTAAHAVTWQPAGIDVVVVGGTPRAVDRVVIHPGYRKLPQALIDDMLKSDDPGAVSRFLASSDDIALLRLAAPVRDVVPVPLYDGVTVGKVFRIIGRGATGNGTNGHSMHGPNRTDLRQGDNRIDTAKGRWLGYRFDAPPEALPREAAAGNGDSGGPLLIAVGDAWHVAGITSWKRVEGSVAAFCPGRYGQVNHALRLAHYRDWIAATMAADGPAAGSR